MNSGSLRIIASTEGMLICPEPFFEAQATHEPAAPQCYSGKSESRRIRNSARRIATDTRIAAPIASKAAALDFAPKPTEGEIGQRARKRKARKRGRTPSLDDFHFDPTQPLRLITREKPEPDKYPVPASQIGSEPCV